MKTNLGDYDNWKRLIDRVVFPMVAVGVAATWYWPNFQGRITLGIVGILGFRLAALLIRAFVQGCNEGDDPRCAKTPADRS